MQAQLWNLMLCYAVFEEERKKWRQKYWVEMKSRIPQICYQCIHESCEHIAFWTKRWHVLGVVHYILNIRTRCALYHKRCLFYPNMHESCVYIGFWYQNISFCQQFSMVWNHWGDLRFHSVLHIWDDNFLKIRFHFRAAFAMGKEVGWLFLAVGGRSSMGEWQLTATGEVRGHFVAFWWMCIIAEIIWDHLRLNHGSPVDATTADGVWHPSRQQASCLLQTGGYSPISSWTFLGWG